jgi:plastocyanin
VNAGQTVTINTVSAGQYSFDPTPVTVKVGQTVTWTNDSGTNHTVKADPGQTVSFSSPTVKNGEQFVFSFPTAGTYTYFCAIHSKASMSGTIVVTP